VRFFCFLRRNYWKPGGLILKVRIQGKNGHKIVELNRRKAIRERCLNCVGWSVKDVKECEMTDCHLFQFRSGQGNQDSKMRAKAIRKFCLWCMCERHIEVSKCTAPDCPLFAFRKSTIDRSIKIDSI
jgi:hypothetical protein